MNDDKKQILYPIVDLTSCSAKKVLEYFQHFGFLLVKDTLFGHAKIQTYFHKLSAFFNEIRQAEPGFYTLADSIHGAYIPAGLEHVSTEIYDAKEVFDYFHRDSYTYEYYTLRARTPPVPLAHAFLTTELVQIKQHIFPLFHQLLNLCTGHSDPAEFGLWKQTNYLLRMIHYPPILEPTPNLTRLGAHVDDDLFALVIAENSRGLKINTPAYGWLALPEAGDSFVVLLGGGLEFITDGEFKGTEHKVDCGDHPSQSRYVFNINLGTDLDFIRHTNTGKTLRVADYYQQRLFKYSLLTTERKT